MVTTEVAVFFLKEGVTADSLPTSPIHLKGMKTVLSQPGCLMLLWGVPVEDDRKMYWLIEWENYEAHKKFIDSDIYAAFGSELVGALADTSRPEGPIRMTHHDFQPPLSELITQDRKTIEFFRFKCKPDISDEQFTKTMDGFRETAAGSGIKSAYDRAMEDPNDVLCPLVWSSVEEHMKWRETDAFKSAIGPIRAVMDSPQVHHVAVTAVKPGFEANL